MLCKVRTLGGRLSFLLNKMQSDEESRVLLKEEAKKTEAQARHPFPPRKFNASPYSFEGSLSE